MLVTTKYCVIGETVVEFVTAVGDNKVEQTFNILLPEKSSSEDAPIAEITTATPDPITEQPPEVIAQPLGDALPLKAASPPQKGKFLPAAIRFMYTTIFTLLGMAGAAFAYLKDNIGQLTDIKLQTVLIVVGGALLAGLCYGLKKYVRPEGLL